MVTCGVPQGTFLGPLLFSLYINDLPANLQSSVRHFADDALLHGIIFNEDDCNRLQADLFELERWQDRWQMKFNPSKCKIICISTKKSPPPKKYVFCGSLILSYLGVTFTNNLKWSQHVSSISGLIKRTFWNCPPSVKETAYIQHWFVQNWNMAVKPGTPTLKRTFHLLKVCRGKQPASVQTTTNLQIVLLGS